MAKFLSFEDKKNILKFEEKCFNLVHQRSCTMTVVVSILGAKEFDSGKTTFSTSLILTLRKKGKNATGFKPLAGHECIEQYDFYLKNLQESKLYGHDAYFLQIASQVTLPIEVINPVDIMTKYDLNFEGHYSSVYDDLGIGRFSFYEEDRIKNIYYYRKGLKDKLCIKLLDKLKLKAEEVIEVSSFEEFLEIHKKYYQRSVSSMFNFLKKFADTIVIESFNDSVYPAQPVEESELIFVCNLNEIYVYEKEQFLESIKESKDPFLLRFKDISEKMKPKYTFKLPFLESTDDEKQLEKQAKEYSLELEKIAEQLKLTN